MAGALGTSCGGRRDGQVCHAPGLGPRFSRTREGSWLIYFSLAEVFRLNHMKRPFLFLFLQSELAEISFGSNIIEFCVIKAYAGPLDAFRPEVAYCG